MNWGTKIALSFVGFALIMLTMVVISMNEDINLVAEDYYLQELAYEDQIDRIKNTNGLQEAPTITHNKESKTIEVAFPTVLGPDFLEGEIYLFRPSDSKYDVKAKIQLNEDFEFSMPVANRAKGLWMIKLLWSNGNIEFYDEKKVVL